MSGNGGMRGFWAALTNHSDRRYQGAQASATLIVTRVEKDSSGGVLAAYGTLQGEGDTEFYMPLRGASAAVGDHLLGTYPANNPAGGELSYVRHVFSSDPAAGLLVPDANLPAPAWDTVPLTTALDASTGGISSYVVAYFLAVEARYQPSGYTVSYRAAGGQWADQPVPHLGGAQQARLAINFPPGTTVDVRLRARYNWAQAESVESETRSITAAVDDITPGTATGLTVRNDTPGQLLIYADGTLDAAHFKDWQFEIATSAAGANLAVQPDVSPHPFPGAGGDYYVAVRPRSKSNVLGGRYPASGYAGPYTLNNPATPVDTTPPPDWAAPTLFISREVTNNGGERAKLTIQLPTGYSYPADYLETLAYVVSNGDQQAPVAHLQQGITLTTLYVPFGTTVVTLRGLDKSGNLSTNMSPSASVTLAASGAPGSAPTLTASTFALAIKLDWAAVAGALAYEVQRAPDVAGAPGTFATVATVDARMWLDTLSTETIVLPSYWYQVRAINQSGTGPYSAQQKGTAGAVDAANLRLASITAAQVAADAIAANAIQAGAVTAGKLAADLVIASNIRTAASGARVEIHGQVPGDPNLNSILMVASSGLVRAKFSGDALSFLNDSGVAAITFGASGGIGYMQSAGGFTVRGDYTDLSLTNSQYMRWSYAQGDGGSAPSTFLYLTRVRSGGVSVGIGLLGYAQSPGGTSAPRIIFGATTDPLNATTNLPADRTEIAGGNVYSSGNYQLVGGLYLAGSGRSLKYNLGAATFDFDAPVRQANSDGSAWKAMHTGTAGNAHQDWSHGSLYLGWYTNPAGQVIVGNGTQSGYGVIVASNVTVPSSETIKTNITDLRGMWAKVAQLRPRAYELNERPGVTQYGFVAEEVRAIFPDLVPEVPAAPYPGPVAPEYLPQPTPSLDLYALVTAVAAGVLEVMPQLEARIGALEATVADLAARLSALESKGAA